MSEALEALRILQLPYRSSAEVACSAALARELSASGLQPSEFVAWAELEISRWKVAQEPSSPLTHVVAVVGRSAAQGEPPVVSQVLSTLMERYFTVHRALMQEHGLNFPQAISSLSHAAAIIRLAVEDFHSSAQIARILAPKDQRASFSRQIVGDILRHAGCEPKLSRTDIRRLFYEDEVREIHTFADADLKRAIVIVSTNAGRFGVADVVDEALSVLGPEERDGRFESDWTPYLQILHYQCSIAEFFDHAVIDLYEFKPRGAAATWLFEQYPHSIAGAQNPFLNNAKSVELLTEAWVRSKKSAERPGARAIFALLSTLDSLGFAARRELCKWLRIWLHRVIRQAKEVPSQLPGFLTSPQIESLFSAVAQGNTGTFGIIEQRVLDCIAYVRHQGWRARGVGDSVHATNLSSYKFGDCEFIDAGRRIIEAYEAHGGRLSPLYIEQHLLTLEKSISRRLDELNSYDDVGNWLLRINFVAHEIGSVQVRNEEILGLRVEVIPVTFRDFVGGLLIGSDQHRMIGAVQDLLLSPMRERRTPNVARSRVVELAGTIVP